MPDQFDNVAFVPLRGGSKGIPGKNIKPFNGYPLCYWAISAAQNAKSIDRVFVSTDSDEISRAVLGFGFAKVEVIPRSKESASDVASSELALLEFAESTHFNTVTFLQATSPLTSARDLDGAMSHFLGGGFNSLVSVVRQKRFIWTSSAGGLVAPVNYELKNRPRRQDWDGYLVENGAFYISDRVGLMKERCRLSGRIGHWEMAEETYFEIDTEADWRVLESLAKNLVYHY